MAVATISGTVGFEASCVQKKCILFGETWFKGMPNCYDFENLPSFKKFDEYKILDRKQIETYFINQIDQYGFPGFQNLSTLPRINKYITTTFTNAQNDYLLKICSYFLKNYARSISH